MPLRHWHHKLLLLKANRQQEQGFILALVVIVGLILAAGAMAMMARSSAGFLGSVRQQQSREAREIAEAGTSQVVERLNRQYAYLLINCYDRDVNTTDWINCSTSRGVGTWQNPSYPQATCPGATLDAASMPNSGTVATSVNSVAGNWRLEFYHFKGSKLYGGLGVMRVRGQRLAADGTTVLAEAYVDQELSIKPKNCDAAFNQPPTSTGFPGLMASTVELGNNDVLGAVSGNILCIGCASSSDVTQGPRSVVNGSIYASEISLPDVPLAPVGLSPSNAITGPGTYTAGSSNGGKCLVDTARTPAITHCILGNINLTGSQQLTFDTSNGPMQLYLQCDPRGSWCSGPNINLGGTTSIRHCKAGNCAATTFDPTELALFGNPVRELPQSVKDAGSTICGAVSYDSQKGKWLDSGSQQILLGGGSQALVMFAYVPDACGGINGGSANPDVFGALWFKSFGPVGSNSNSAELRVPDDMGAKVFTRFGTGYALSVRDFVAIGINNWASFQMPPSASGMFQ